MAELLDPSEDSQHHSPYQPPISVRIRAKVKPAEIVADTGWRVQWDHERGPRIVRTVTFG